MTRDANIATTTTTTITSTTPTHNNLNTIPLSTCSTPSSSSTLTFSSAPFSPIVTALPSLCIQHIFSFLNRTDLLKTLLVCKSWHLASVSRLWSHFKFVREREFERIFSILSKHQQQKSFRSSLASGGGGYGNYITSLELVHSERDFCINSNHVFLITLLCPNLLSISITFHHTRPVAPPGKPLQGQGNGLVLGSGGGSGKLPPPLMARQQHLQQVQQHHLQQQQQQQAQHQQAQHQQAQQQSKQQQRHTAFTTSLPLAHFAHNCPKLKSIRLVSYSPKTDDSVYEMAKYLTSGSLESIQFTNCLTIQSSTLCKLAITNPQLKSIEIIGNTPISDSSLATLVDRCLDLEYLSIGNAHNLTDKSMRYIAARCKKLKRMCLFNNNVERITQDTLTLIIQHCPNLQMMSLSDSRALGAAFFESVVQRVNHEITKIYNKQAKVGSGLQTLCLGGVKRDMISSKYIQELIDKSASKHDLKGRKEEEEEEEEEEQEDLQQMSSLGSSSKFMPKSTIIRGNTIWWQRQRILVTS